jgi:hypothetical protein
MYCVMTMIIDTRDRNGGFAAAILTRSAPCS